MPTKFIFASKTFWTQVLALASLLFPEVRSWVSENPVEFAAAWAALNVLVRFVTHGKVTILEPAEDSDKAGGPGGYSLLVVMGTAGCLLGALPSCAGYPLKASVLLEEGRLSYSSKGGLEMEYRPGYGQMPEVYRKGNK